MTAIRRALLGAVLLLAGLFVPAASAHTNACVGTGTLTIDADGAFTVSLPETCVAGAFYGEGQFLAQNCPLFEAGWGSSDGHHEWILGVMSSRVEIVGDVQGTLVLPEADPLDGRQCGAIETPVVGFVTVRD